MITSTTVCSDNSGSAGTEKDRIFILHVFLLKPEVQVQEVTERFAVPTVCLSKTESAGTGSDRLTDPTVCSGKTGSDRRTDLTVCSSRAGSAGAGSDRKTY